MNLELTPRPNSPLSRGADADLAALQADLDAAVAALTAATQDFNTTHDRRAAFLGDLMVANRSVATAESAIEELIERAAKGAISVDVVTEKREEVASMELRRRDLDKMTKIAGHDVEAAAKKITEAKRRETKAKADIAAAILWRELPRLAAVYVEFHALFLATRLNEQAGPAVNLSALLAEICPQLRDQKQLLALAAEIVAEG